ncbi:hypothetical protein FJ957_21275 [Mesorhizobium sp. B2-4-6]|nr:hypothetical protein FJ957_21275 [Mesorhizobium sp. B2-4-6]
MRYELREDPAGWTVWDLYHDEPVTHGGRLAVGLTRLYADDLVALLVASDMKRTITRGPAF